jgi:integrase
MVLLGAGTGLRRSELFALKWENLDFTNSQITVRRSIYHRVIGCCKPETSHKPVPMDALLTAELSRWKSSSKYQQPADWVFASPRTAGKHRIGPMLVSHESSVPLHYARAFTSASAGTRSGIASPPC